MFLIYVSGPGSLYKKELTSLRTLTPKSFKYSTTLRYSIYCL